MTKHALQAADEPPALGRFLLRAFLALFAFAFALVLGGVVFANTIYHTLPAVLLPLMAVYAATAYAAWRLLRKYAAFLSEKYKTILLCGAALLFAANIITGLVLRFEPAFDLGAIFTGASEWATSGNFLARMNPTCDADYFYYFPNNLGGMALLFVPFKLASLLGIADFYCVAVVLNALLTAATALVVPLVCKRLLGVFASLLALVCMLLFPPFWFSAAAFYTDSLSMLFPVLLFYLYLRGEEQQTRAGKYGFAALMGLVAAVGMLVKFTVVIALIAIVLHALCTGKFRSCLRVAAVCGAVILAVNGLFDLYFYTAHLEREKAEALNTPKLHWVMMSLQGDGRYNPEDYAFTRSFDDPAEQRAAIWGRIGTRIKDKGALGMLELFYKKSVTAFGDGTLAQSDFLDDNPTHETALHELVLYDGAHFSAYRHICSAQFFALLLFMLLSAMRQLCAKQLQPLRILPLIAVFGILVFLLFWEVSGRYITNFVPLMFVAAVSGAEGLFGNWKRPIA